MSDIAKTKELARTVSHPASGMVSRIVSAIHLVTNHIHEDEPVRLEMRRSGISLISSVSRGASIRAEDTVNGCIKIRLLVGVAHDSGFISEAHREILDRGIERLITTLAYDGNVERLRSTLEAKDESPIGQSAGTSIEDIKDSKRQYKGQLIMSDTNGLEQPLSKEDREQRIIELMRKKGAVSTRDVATAITECSEKTLQRELMRLVSTGRVVKEGERRWSTYRIRENSYI